VPSYPPSEDEPRARLATRPPITAVPTWYDDLLHSVAARITTGHRRAVAAANGELIRTYWAIGRDIVDRQDEEGWGAKVIDRLSADLSDRFPDTTGYSPRSLKYMRALASAWPEEAIVQAPLAQLPWYHHLALLTKLRDPDLRRWYAAAAVEHGWSRDVLAHQIDSQLHERTGKAITNFRATLPATDSDLAQQATRDPYLFDFLAAAGPLRERDLERQLVDHVGAFLLELGQGFAFVGRQVLLEVGDRDFRCDLLFYHLKLRRYVVIELKAVDFDPSFLGQLGLYMSAVDDLLATEADGATIGLLLCRTKNAVVAEYALRGYQTPIGVADWATTISTSLPDELATSLPSIGDLEAELSDPPDPRNGAR
jgi:predicted nuclease of restriction endonuclease-like (RecB) superfamily